MSQVRVPAQWLSHGTLPPVCARHGGPATIGTARTFYSRTPIWVLLLILITLILALIVALALRKTVEGRLPGCARCTADRRQFVRRTQAGWAAVLVVFVGLVITESEPLSLLWAVGFIAAVVFGFCGDRFRVAGHVSKDGAWVELRGVSEEFARAVDAALSGLPAQPLPSGSPQPRYGGLPAQPPYGGLPAQPPYGGAIAATPHAAAPAPAPLPAAPADVRTPPGSITTLPGFPPPR